MEARRSQETVDQLRAQLRTVSASLSVATGVERMNVLRRMWELSGRIAEAKQGGPDRGGSHRADQDQDESVGSGAA